MTSPAAHSLSAARPAATRSAVSNGRRLFVEADARGPWARRFRDLCELHADDLGGASRLSEAQLSLIRRAATLETELERMEGLLATGSEDVSLDEYQRAANSLRRLLESLGIERKARDITPSLADYIRARDDQQAKRAAAAP